MAHVEKGKITAIEPPLDRNGDLTRARVDPDTRPGEVSRPLVIPWYLRGDMGELEVGTPVIFSVFEDLEGFLLHRVDGEWPGIVPGDVEVQGTGTVEDLITPVVPSYNRHKHSGVESGADSTGGPS